MNRPHFQAALLLAAALGLVPLPTAGDEPARFRGSVEVVRILTEARVVGPRGRPVTDLSPGDFEVTVDGVRAEVESARWIPGRDRGVGRTWVAPDPEQPGPPPVQPGRMVVFLVQTDFHRSRLPGLFRISRHTHRILERLAPGDRAALAVFTSHLQLREDFTDEFHRIGSGLKVMQIFGPAPPTPKAGPYPSLAAHLDREQARRAATISRALETVADALEPLPGPKTVILIGWGLGRFTSTGVKLEEDALDAFVALAEARTTVFVLDVTQADRHSLEVGLKAVAEDTGGTYSRTFHFPELAVRRLANVLEGYWELSIRRPAEIEGRSHRISIDVGRPGARVLSRPYVLGTP